MSACTRQGSGDRQAGERRSSGDLGFGADKRAGAHALRRGWIGVTMKPLIGYGSDVSARVLHDLPAMRHPLGRIVVSD